MKYININSNQVSVLNSSTQQTTTPVKPVTDEQVFYDKFLCYKFYLPSARA